MNFQPNFELELEGLLQDTESEGKCDSAIESIVGSPCVNNMELNNQVDECVTPKEKEVNQKWKIFHRNPHKLNLVVFNVR